MRNGNGDFLDSDTTISKSYWKQNIWVVEKRCKKKYIISYASPYAFFSSTSVKKIRFSKRKRIVSGTYLEMNSTGKKEKVNIKIDYD